MKKEQLLKTLDELKTNGYDYLKDVTAVDYVTYLEVVYILYNIKLSREEIVKVQLDPKNPKTHTIMDKFPAADWYEREMSEMFGIGIVGRRAKRLLLEEWNGISPPLRKSFAWGKDYEKE